VEATIATGKLWCSFPTDPSGDVVAEGARVADGAPNADVAFWNCEVVELRAMLVPLIHGVVA
jgi:hypothetical protein